MRSHVHRLRTSSIICFSSSLGFLSGKSKFGVLSELILRLRTGRLLFICARGSVERTLVEHNAVRAGEVIDMRIPFEE